MNLESMVFQNEFEYANHHWLTNTFKFIGGVGGGGGGGAGGHLVSDVVRNRRSLRSSILRFFLRGLIAKRYLE